MTITDKAIAAIKSSNIIKGKLMVAFDRGENTIENWMASKDVRLTTPTATKIILEHSDLKESELLEQDPVEASKAV